MAELDLFRNFRRGVAAPSPDARRRASARLASALQEATGREQAARLHQGRRRWRAVALAAVILVAVLLVTPAFTFGIGDRLLSLIQDKPTPLDVQAPAWSRDGRTIVFVSWRDGNGEVYAMDADGSSPRNLTQDPAKDAGPAWSPDGRRIAFVSRRDGNSEVYVMNADGSGKRNLTRDRASDDYPTWSPDGRRLAFLRGRLHSNRVPGLGVHRWYTYHLYVMHADGSGLRRLTRNQTGTSTHHQLVWSPDGRTIYCRALPRQRRRERSAEAPVHTVYRRLVARRAEDRLRAPQGPDVRSVLRLVAGGYLRHERRRERNTQADAQRRP